jgi:hypothetical protein
MHHEDQHGQPIPCLRTLIEVRAAEGRSLLADDPKQTGHHYERASASTAHQWVKKGWLHETALWVDDFGRIRRAGGKL